MAFFGDIGLAYQFAIILGGLILLTFAAGFLRLYWKQRQLHKNQIKQDIEAAEKATQKAVMREGVLGEGDLFGVRAIEKGFYGGVAQSTPTSAATSPRLSPVSITDGDGIPITGSGSPGSSIPEFSLSRDEHCARSARKQVLSMSLRLQPSDAERSGRRNHDPSVTVSTYIPTSTLGIDSLAQPQSEPVSRTSTPSSIPSVNQVQSYAQWRLSNNRRTARSVSRSDSQISGIRSQAGSIVDHNTSPDTCRDPRAGRKKSRSVSSVDVENHLRSLQQNSRNQSPLVASDRLSAIARSASDYGYFDQLSNYKISQQGTLSSGNSSAESSARSSQRRSRSRSQDADAQHYRQSSTDSARSIRRTRDSVRHIRKSSVSSVMVRRRSISRDAIHYDPSEQCRSISGSIQGRSVNFDVRRSTPFEEARDSSGNNSTSSSSPDFRSRSGSGSSAETAPSLASKTDAVEHRLDAVSNAVASILSGTRV